MEVIKQTSWVLPLMIEAKIVEVQDHRVEDLIQFSVVTSNGTPVGPRILKGDDSPVINSWGPFCEFEQAEKLKNRLTAHVEKCEERKGKRIRRGK